jgi:amicoumacin kinase
LSLARQRYQEYFERRLALPRDRDSFGMIHEDAHMGNMFVDENGRITLFDFDDCNYSWFANDIAIVLFYMITGEEDPAGLTARFMPPFLTGYAHQNKLDPSWLETIPLFLKVREIELFGVLHRSFDNPEEVDNAWIKSFMEDRRSRIEADTPYVDFNFTQVAAYLSGQ